MKKGELVVKIIAGAGCKSATIEEIESVKNKVIRLVDCESLSWNSETLLEIDATIPGFYSFLVPLDGGEEERLRTGVGK